MISACNRCNSKVKEDDVVCISCGNYLKEIPKTQKEWNEAKKNNSDYYVNANNIKDQTNEINYAPVKRNQNYNFIGFIKGFVTLVFIIGGLGFIVKFLLFNNSAKAAGLEICNGLFVKPNYKVVKKYTPDKSKFAYSEEEFKSAYEDGLLKGSTCSFVSTEKNTNSKTQAQYEADYNIKITRVENVKIKITNYNYVKMRTVDTMFIMGKSQGKWVILDFVVY